MFFLNPRGELLLLLRDDKPEIPYPNTWDLPGGHVEGNESPRECISREMAEELPGLDLGDFRLYEIVELPQQINHIFWTRIDVGEEVLNSILCEGQRAAWMSRAQIRDTQVAFGFGAFVERFFDRLERGVLGASAAGE
ncbi:MAG: NUDIX domain-containing protein [Candidatus Binatia bacterium]